MTERRGTTTITEFEQGCEGQPQLNHEGLRDGGRRMVTPLSEKQCFYCHQWRHLTYNCPNRSAGDTTGAENTNAVFDGLGQEGHDQAMEKTYPSEDFTLRRKGG